MLYTKIDALSDEYKYDVDVSYVEIYNENLKDLLSPGKLDKLLFRDILSRLMFGQFWLLMFGQFTRKIKYYLSVLYDYKYR